MYLRDGSASARTARNNSIILRRNLSLGPNNVCGEIYVAINGPGQAAADRAPVVQIKSFTSLSFPGGPGYRNPLENARHHSSAAQIFFRVTTRRDPVSTTSCSDCLPFGSMFSSRFCLHPCYPTLAGLSVRHFPSSSLATPRSPIPSALLYGRSCFIDVSET